MLLWIITAAAVLLAGLAWIAARSAARRLDTLTHAYWELRYEHTALRARVARLDPRQDAGAGDVPVNPSSGTDVAFVPLSSLRTAGRSGPGEAARGD